MSTPPSPATLPPAPTILAVDDDRAVLSFVQQVLKSAGYRVLVADGGRSAVRAFESATEPVHLLLTDVVMPDLPGHVLAERLLARQPGLRVLFISGFHDTSDVRRLVEQKGFSLLPKPFTIDGLLREVEESLKHSD